MSFARAVGVPALQGALPGSYPALRTVGCLTSARG
jgi:hypothetical protein